MPHPLQYCRAPWDGAVVHFSGRVYPCDQLGSQDQMDKMMLGDLNKQPLSSILSGQRATELREGLLSGSLEGLLCETCDKRNSCNLYGDPVQGEAVGTLHGGAEPILKPLTHEPLGLQRLELAINDLCNARCTMCALTRGDASPPGGPKNGMMSLELAKRTLHEAAELVPPGETALLLLHWVGEPLIHPDVLSILEEVAKLPFRLHLVTNGIALNERVSQALMHMKGTINISLNALHQSTYSKVNGVDRLSLVSANIERFMSIRKGFEENWTVIVSSVILEENYREMLDFVGHWKVFFERFGAPADVSLNGKGEHGPHQIMLLKEIEEPICAAAFRYVLRQMKLESDRKRVLVCPIGGFSCL